MPTVEVRFTPLPANVRTARLVALAVARRAGVAEDLLDEVRFAVGEACSRAVGVHTGRASDEPVTMVLSDDADRFAVEVSDIGSVDDDSASPSAIDPDVLSDPQGAERDPEVDVLPPGFGLAVISGLVETVDVQSTGNGTTVRMVWPSENPLAPTA
jgi:anti-sigma regulatory factor (Ser/Thr protein kinase)